MSPLPLPALHATHAGIWIAERGEGAREASPGEAIARAPEAASALQAIAGALLAVLERSDWQEEREGAWTSCQSLARMGWGWAPLINARIERPERGERMLFSRLKQWEEAAD